MRDTARAPHPPTNQSTMHQMNQQGLYVPKKAYFGKNLAGFWGDREKIWYPHIREPMRHFFRVENIDWCGYNWPLGMKMCNFGPKIWVFGAKRQFPPRFLAQNSERLSISNLPHFRVTAVFVKKNRPTRKKKDQKFVLKTKIS